MKKLLSIVLCAMILLATPIALAQPQVTERAEEDIELFYSDASRVYTNLSIDASGNAKCSGTVTANEKTKKCSITVTLKKKSGSSWTSVCSWSGSGTGITGASAGGTKKVSSGTYKVVVTGKIKDAKGNVLETVTKESKSKTY